MANISMRHQATMVIVVLFSIVGFSHAQAARPDGVGALWSTSPGDLRIVDGTYSSNGQLWFRTHYEEVTAGQEPCGEMTCTKYSREQRSGYPGRGEVSFHIDTLQALSPDSSCTWQSLVDGKESGLPGCAFVDLKAPLKAGASWQHADIVGAMEPQLNQYKLKIVYTNTITGTGVTFDSAQGPIHGCVSVRKEARAEPDTPITCRDGSSSAVDSEWLVDTTFCPGIGSVHERATETHRKRGSQNDICSQYLAEFTLTSFVPSKPKKQP